MNKIKRSVKLLKAAFAVLFREKKLLLFPLAASFLVMVVAVFFIAPIVLYPTGHSVFTAEHWQALGTQVSHWFNLEPRHRQPATASDALTSGMGGSTRMLASHPWTTAVFALFYFISMFLATFSNVAFYHEIMRALNGDNVSIRRGYQFACDRWRSVLLWSLFAGLVGYLIQTIQERLGILGRLITGLIGFVWSTACIFVIPTLVRDTENSNPIGLLRKSVGTLRRTWGETVVGFIGIQILSLLSMLTMIVGILLVIGIPAVIFSHPVSPGLKINHLMFYQAALLCVTVVVAATLSGLGGLLNAIYRCALYIYATEGVVPGTFDKELLDSAWKVK